MDEMNELSRRSKSAENARVEAALLQKNSPQFTERANTLRGVIGNTDFLEMGKTGKLEDADALEKRAFDLLEKTSINVPQRTEIKDLFTRAYSIRLRLKFEERIAQDWTPGESLSSAIHAFDEWMPRAGNIPELKEVLADLRETILFKLRFGEEWDFVQQSIKKVAEGKGSTTEQDFVARFFRAVQGIYSRGRSSEKKIIDYYQLGDHRELVSKFAISYRRMARRKIREGELDPYFEGEGAYGININYAKGPRPRRYDDELGHGG